MQFTGLKLTPWQNDVVQDIIADGPKAENIYVIKSRRQLGKSIMLEQLLLYHAITYKNSISICVSITLNQCRKIYKELVNGIIDSGIIASNNNSLLEIELINGSTIAFKSAVQKDNLRGYTIRGGGILVIDEAAYIQEDIFNLIFPWVNVNKANIIITSTPRIKQGTFYTMYAAGVNKVNPHIKSYDWADSKYDTSAFLSEDMLELYRKTMPENQFKNDYLGEFTDDAGSVFNIKLINWNRCGNIRHHTEGYKDLFIGIDWGTGVGNDYTVISGFSEDYQQRLLLYCNKTTPTEQIEWIVKNIREKTNINKIRGIICESNSIGTVYLDMLRRQLPKNIKVIPFNTSNDSKREIIENMCKLIGEEKLTLYLDDEQQRQFAAYAMELTPSGKVTYNAPYGIHDDIVMASAIALSGVGKKSSYIISF